MAERDITAKLKADITDYNSKITSAEKRTIAFTNNLKRSFDSVGKSAKNLFQGNFSFLGGAVAGAAIYETIKKVGEFEDKVREVANQAHMTTADMLGFKEQILDTGIKTGVSTDGLIEMSKAAQTTGANMSFVRSELSFFAKVSQASGMSAEETGKSLGQLQMETGLTGEAFEALVKRLGDFGDATGSRMHLKQFLPDSHKLLLEAQLMAKEGSIKDIGRVLMEGEFSGAPDAVAKAYKTLHSGKNKRYIQELGLKQGYTLTDAIQAVVSKAKLLGVNPEAAFKTLFGGNYNALEPLINGIDKFTAAEKEAKANDNFMDKANEKSKDFGSAMNRLNSVFLSLSDKSIAPMLDAISNSLSTLTPEQLEGLGDAFKLFGEALGALTKAVLAFPSDKIKEIFDMWGNITGQHKADWQASVKAGEVFGAGESSKDTNSPVNALLANQNPMSPSSVLNGLNKPKEEEPKIEVHNNITVNKDGSVHTVTSVGKKGKQGMPTNKTTQSGS